MRKIFVLYAIVLLVPSMASGQADSTVQAEIFQKISREMQSFVIDTSSAPDDRITKKIIELRQLKGVFNINEAIAFKIEEEAKENKTPKATLDLLKKEFQGGRAKQLLDNAVINIYRKHFTYDELKQMVKFYRTSAGQKLAADFPFIMFKSLAAAQVIHDMIVARGQ